MTAGASGSDDAIPYPTPGQGWYVVAVLMLVTLTSYLDRSVPALVVDPLRREFGVGDGAIGLLQGYSFYLIYTVIGLPLGRLVDVSNRRRLILIGIAIWTVMTFASAFVVDFWQLVVARAGVGIGEAVLGPAAYSIIADYFAPRMHGRAIGTYFLSIYAGAGLSLVLGAVILGHVAAFAGLPVLGDLAPWRLLFAVAALPGLPALAILLTVREPVRRNVSQRIEKHDGSTFAELFAHIGQHRVTFAILIVTYLSFVFATTGTSAWGPTFYARRFGLEMRDAGRTMGIATLLGGVTGCLAVGWISDRFHGTGAVGGRLRATLVAFALAIPATLAWPLVDDVRVGLVLLFLATTGGAMGAGVAPSVIQQAVTNRMRGKAIALYALVGGLLGSGFSPTAIALVASHVAPPGADGLRLAMLLTMVPLLLLGALLCWLGLRSYQNTVTAIANP